MIIRKRGKYAIANDHDNELVDIGRVFWVDGMEKFCPSVNHKDISQS